MCMTQRSKTIEADKALHRYYKLQNTSYLDENGIGKLKLWADDNGYDSDLIEDELNIDASESVLIDIDHNFPPNNLKPDEILNILRKCWIDSNAYLPFEYEKSFVHRSDNRAIAKTAVKFISKHKSYLIITGYCFEKNKRNSLAQPILELIFDYYYLLYNTYQFALQTSSSMRCSSGHIDRYPNECYYELSENNTKVTKISETAFWLVSNIIGIKTGIHVFRYFLYLPPHVGNCNGKGVVVGMQRFDPGFDGGASLFHNGGVIGWHAHGTYIVKKDDENDKAKTYVKKHVNEELKAYFSFESKIATFDLKLNCVESLLSFKLVYLDEKNFKSDESVIEIPVEFTKIYGWVPHITIAAPSQVVMICEINPDFYGIHNTKIYNPIYKIISKDPKTISELNDENIYQNY